MGFIEILQDILRNNGFTQTQLAQIIGVKQSQVSEWLKGKAKPGYDTLKAMAQNLGVSSDYLLGLEDETGNKIYSDYKVHDGDIKI